MSIHHDDPLKNPWCRHDYARRRHHLVLRGKLRSRLRTWFAGQNFLEVETPSLQISPGWEAHIQPFSTMMEINDVETRRYLRTSPEIAMKKLLAAGETSIYQLCQAYRNGESSPLHQPEFTILEWYRTHQSDQQALEAILNDCQSLIRYCAEPDHLKMTRHHHSCDIASTWRHCTVSEAFRIYAGIDILASLSDQGMPDRDHLAKEAVKADVSVAQDDAWDDIFHKIFYAHIQPHLGVNQPDILTHYPAPLAALAALSPDDPRQSQRFEIFIHGIELANGCVELRDTQEHQSRYRCEHAIKQSRYGREVPEDDNFIRAIESGLPPCAGVALGFDRLVLLFSGAEDIRDVLWEALT